MTILGPCSADSPANTLKAKKQKGRSVALAASCWLSDGPFFGWESFSRFDLIGYVGYLGKEMHNTWIYFYGCIEIKSWNVL